jgi:hypothetical protein
MLKPPAMAALVTFANVTKRFGSFTAVDGLILSDASDLHA